MNEVSDERGACCGGSPLCDRNWRNLPRYRSSDLLNNPASNGQRADFERSVLERAGAQDSARSEGVGE